MKYSSRERAYTVVKNRLLQASGASPELVSAILEEDNFIEGFGGAGWDPDPQEKSPFADFMTANPFPRSKSEPYYAIRNDDLKFAEDSLSVVEKILENAPVTYAAIKAILVAGAPVAAAFGVLPVAVTSVAAVGFIRVGLRLRKKGVDLSEDEYKVLIALKHHGPQSVPSLTFILNGMKLSATFSGVSACTATVRRILCSRSKKDTRHFMEGV
jgi:hypothetical protein